MPDEVYSTGARRSNRTGKGRYDLLPPRALHRLAKLAEYGALRYGERNNERGIPSDRCIDSALRHLFARMRGERDPDHGDNLAAAVWNIMQVIENEELGREPAPRPVDPVREIPSTPAPTATVAPAKPLHLYIAGPFSAPTVEARERNMLLAAWVGLVCAQAGHLVHVPHVATSLWHGTLDYEYFMLLDLSIIDHWATALLLVRPSPGANRERDRAIQKGIPVYERVADVPGCTGATLISWREFYHQHARRGALYGPAKTD